MHQLVENILDPNPQNYPFPWSLGQQCQDEALLGHWPAIITLFHAPRFSPTFPEGAKTLSPILFALHLEALQGSHQ